MCQMKIREKFQNREILKFRFKVLWIYQNYLRSYLEPVLGPILGPILKPIYAKIEPYIGKYVPNSDSSEAKCPVSGMSSSDNGSCPGDASKTETPTESSDPSPKATKRRVKKLIKIN